MLRCIKFILKPYRQINTERKENFNGLVKAFIVKLHQISKFNYKLFQQAPAKMAMVISQNKEERKILVVHFHR